jgi:hypothetical protein
MSAHSKPGEKESNLYLACTRNRDDIISLGQEPSQRNLASGGSMFDTDISHTVRNGKDVREVLFAEPWNSAAEVVFLEVFRSAILARE